MLGETLHIWLEHNRPAPRLYLPCKVGPIAQAHENVLGVNFGRARYFMYLERVCAWTHARCPCNLWKGLAVDAAMGGILGWGQATRRRLSLSGISALCGRHWRRFWS